MSLSNTSTPVTVTYTYMNHRSVVDDVMPLYPKTVSEAKWNELKSSASSEVPAKTRRVSRYYDLVKVDEQECLRRNEVPLHPVQPVCYVVAYDTPDESNDCIASIIEEVVSDVNVTPTHITITCTQRPLATFPVKYKFYNIQHHTEHVFQNGAIFSQYTERGTTYYEHYMSSSTSSSILSSSR